MKKLLLYLSAGILAAACVDRDYDLSKVETDDIAIGDSDSEYRIPLAVIRIRTAEIRGTAGDIGEMFSDADTWLPTTLPGGAEFLDLTRLEEHTYTDPIFEALFAEMESSSQKLDRVTELALRKYRDAFAQALKVAADQLTADNFREAFLSAQTTRLIRDEARRQALGYLTELDALDPLVYDLGSIDLAGDVVDMLADNLDPRQEPEPRNTLHLYGEIASALPLDMQLEPAFESTGVRFGVEVKAAAGTNPFPASDATRLFADDLRTIVAGTSIRIPVALTRYYPGRSFDQEEQLVIRLRLEKRGALHLKF